MFADPWFKLFPGWQKQTLMFTGKKILNTNLKKFHR